MGDAMNTDTRTFEEHLNDLLKDIERRNDLQEGKILELLDRDTAKDKRISELEGQIRLLTLQQVTLQTTTTRTPQEPKIADPEYFFGSRPLLIPFLSQCQLKFNGQPSKFADEKSKVLYAGSYLRGPAFTWFQPLLLATNKDPPQDVAEFQSFKAFSKSISAVYGDPDLEASAERRLNVLTQTTSVARYNAEFQQLSQYVEWNDPSLKNRFYHGLNDNIKDWLAMEPAPKNLKDLIDKATRYDSRRQERLLEKKASPPHSQNTPSQHTPRTPPPAPPLHDHGETTSTGTGGLKIPPTSPDGTVPMELGARHITAAERDRRRANKLCFYCGDSDHSVFACPKKPAGTNTKRFAEFSFEDIEISSFPPSGKEHTQGQNGGGS
jgi:hypothetical protein